MSNNTTVENTILGCLSFGPKSGYEIKRIISMSTALFYNASYGSIYPILKKHEDNGLVISEELVDNGRYKRIYTLSEAGQRHFDEWMFEAPHPMTIKYEMLVRLFFFKNLKSEEQIRQIENHITQLIKFREELEGIEQIAGQEADEFQLLTLKWGEDLYTFMIKWYGDILKELKKGD